MVRLLDEHDNFLLFETRSLYSPFCHNRPGTRVSESLLDNQQDLLSLSFQKNPNLLIFWAAARIFL